MNSLFSMQFNPKDLKLIAGHAVAKNIKSIKDLYIPEECEAYLGLVELQQLDSSIEIDKSLGGYSIDSKEYLNITAIEFFSKKTFEELIEEKNRQGLPFILAVVTAEQRYLFKRNISKHAYFDAIELNKYFVKQYKSVNRYGCNAFKAPFLNLSIMGQIQYFAINSTLDTKGEFIGTDLDLQVTSSVTEFVNFVFGANNGSAKAQHELAQIYEKSGKITKAKQYYILSAAQGYSYAQNRLGIIYESENDLKQAKRYFMLSANQGNIGAQSNLGFIYEEENDIKQAKYYYTLAASQKNPIAQYNLGLIFEKENDFKRAKHYYILAANQGIASSQNNLGLIYEKENNIEQARYYYKLAANQQLSIAKYNLGYLYESEGDFNKAIHYYTLAASQGNPDAKIKLANLNP